MKNEPALVLSTSLAVVIAGLALLTQFGVNLTADQQTAIVGFAGSVGALIVGIITRSLVTPANKVVSKLDKEVVVAGEASPLPTGTVVDSDNI